MAKKFLTEESKIKLLKELEERKFKIRKKISDEIREAKELGDLSENASYIRAREEESFNEARIEQLEEILRESEIVEDAHKSNVVEIGDCLELSNGLRFTLVDSQQADPPSKISVESPLGLAVYGKKVGDAIEVRLPDNKLERYSIVKIFET